MNLMCCQPLLQIDGLISINSSNKCEQTTKKTNMEEHRGD